MPKLHDQTVAVRLPAKLYRSIVRSKKKTETMSEAVRRLLNVALILLAKDE